MISINLKIDQYFDIRRFFKKNIFYYIIKGGRGVGKSYSILEMFLEDFYDTQCPFIYCRLSDKSHSKLLGAISEIASAADILNNCGIEFTDTDIPKYRRGKPAKSFGINYYDEDNKFQYLELALLCDVLNAGSYKGFAAPKNKRPKFMILDEFTSEDIALLATDVEFNTLDLIETYFRKEHENLRYVFLVTNNNNKNNAFEGLFKECLVISVKKDFNSITNSDKYNRYIAGEQAIDISKNKSFKLIGNYYLNTRDICALYSNDKTGRYFLELIDFNKNRSNARKDIAIFNISDIEFSDNLAKATFIKSRQNRYMLFVDK